jgi:hypothetical protein
MHAQSTQARDSTQQRGTEGIGDRDTGYRATDALYLSHSLSLVTWSCTMHSQSHNNTSKVKGYSLTKMYQTAIWLPSGFPNVPGFSSHCRFDLMN